MADEDSVTQSLIYSGRHAYMAAECPVLLGRVGHGKLGYVGELNSKAGSQAVLLAMRGL